MLRRNWEFWLCVPIRRVRLPVSYVLRCPIRGVLASTPTSLCLLFHKLLQAIVVTPARSLTGRWQFKRCINLCVSVSSRHDIVTRAVVSSSGLYAYTEHILFRYIVISMTSSFVLLIQPDSVDDTRERSKYIRTWHLEFKQHVRPQRDNTLKTWLVYTTTAKAYPFWTVWSSNNYV